MARVYNILLTASDPILPLYLWQSCVARRTCQLHPQKGNKDSAESAWNMVRSLCTGEGCYLQTSILYCNFTCRPPKMGEHGIIAFPTKMYTVVFILYFYVVLLTAIVRQPFVCHHNFQVVQISLLHVFAKAGESPRKMHTYVPVHIHNIQVYIVHRFLIEGFVLPFMYSCIN